MLYLPQYSMPQPGPARLCLEEQGTPVSSELSISTGMATLVTAVHTDVSHQPTRCLASLVLAHSYQRLPVWSGSWG